MKQYPNLRHVRLFCQCLQSGSVSRAADLVGISQPAASQALARLEAIFDATLIDPQHSTPVATEEGRIVLTRAQRALELIRTGCARLRGPTNERNDSSVEGRLTISHLRALSAFAEGGSFSAAARILEQSEPAVHRTARDAELTLETALLEGSGRAIRLSSAGTSAARWSRLALNELENAAAELRELRGRYEGHVSVGTLPLVRTSIIPEVIARISARHPLASFAVAEGRYDDLRRDLEMGRIEILVGALRTTLRSNMLVQEKLFTYQLSVVARADHPLAAKKALTAAGLAEYPWVVARQGTPSRETFDALTARFPPGRPAHRAVETGSLVAVRGILMKSDHLALLSQHQIEYEMRAGFLAPLDFDLPSPEHSIGMTTRRQWKPTALQSEFIETLREIRPEGD
ncbi:LysR substrate-binding domain-containing protein [Chelativorans sp. YIM 93263]|uniref:LysR substrate-binding domain-containing protein n=1 Tax=Chelativorans sp. YIM 93263 TaxID=2906648 RepID=UPI0023790002|nr:LysR substrate-binding domain-containing protein [Chelativorans sp. YIM 93263]